MEKFSYLKKMHTQHLYHLFSSLLEIATLYVLMMF